MMFFCTTCLLKRRRAFSTVSPSWSLTSAKRHLHPASILPLALWGLRRWSRIAWSQPFRQFLAGLETRIPFCGDGDGLPSARVAALALLPLFHTKLPSPRRSTRSFAWSASAIIARTESTATSTSDFFNSVLAATFSINCCFVILFEFSGLRGEACSASQLAAGYLHVDPYPCREPGPDNPHPEPDRTPWNPHPPRKRSPPKTTARSGTSGAFPWSWTYFQVLRGPDEIWREEKYI